jgi:hypothetical protein
MGGGRGGPCLSDDGASIGYDLLGVSGGGVAPVTRQGRSPLVFIIFPASRRPGFSLVFFPLLNYRPKVQTQT